MPLEELKQYLEENGYEYHDHVDGVIVEEPYEPPESVEELLDSLGEGITLVVNGDGWRVVADPAIEDGIYERPAPFAWHEFGDTPGADEIATALYNAFMQECNDINEGVVDVEPSRSEYDYDELS